MFQFNNLENFEEISKLHIGSAIEAIGPIVKSEGSGQDFEMKVEKQFSDYTFRRMMTNYVDHLNLEFIKTTQEIKKQCKNTSIYSR